MNESASATLRRRLLLCTALMPILATMPANANPTGGTVIAGRTIIGPGGRSLTITQTSDRAIINWQSFSIGAGETTRFNLPSATAAVLNRVTGTQLSALLGNLYSNGQVYLLNPNGIVIGPKGRVNTGGFIASTLDMPNQQFMQGGAQTLQGGSTAGVVVLGTVKASSGDVLLVAAQVDNQGKLIAPDGQVILAAGSEVLYVPGPDSNIAIEAASPAPANGAAVNNTGLIKAASVQLAAAGSPYALAVNNGGVIEAGSVRRIGGHVMLSAGDGDAVSSGTIAAAGGTVTLTGGRVALTGAAVVNVAAPGGGGSVTLAASNAIAVTAGARINASATVTGNGGHISIKAGKATQFAGTATATGGAQGGNGGSAEISGGMLIYTGSVNLTAPRGATGTLLFDPATIDVVSGDAAAPADISGGLWGFSQDNTSGQTISVGAIESLLQSSNLELQASTSLTFDTPTGTGSFVTLASNTTNALTLTAPTITINASISLPNGRLVFNWPDADVTTYSTTAQSVTSAASATITAGILRVAGNYNTVTLNGAVTTGSLQFTEPDFNAFSITINNAANAISAVSLDPGGSNGAQTVDIESSTAMALSGSLQNYNSATFVAGGDLTLQSGFALTGGAQTVFASTGGVFNNLAGTSAYSSGNGKLRIYSSTNGTGASGTAYNANGIANGATTQGGVTYPSNPDTFDSVVAYFATVSSEPVLTVAANSFSRTYGQSDPTFTATYAGGSGGGVTELTTLPSFRILQGSDINAGTYTIQPYGATSSQDLLSYVNGTLTVNPAVLTVVANPASMTYGGTVPTFTAGISGFVNGDTSSLVSGLTVGSNAGSTPPAGSYTITPSGVVVPTPVGGVEPNYTVNYQTATFTVNPAPLSIAAVPASANYGGAIPTFQLNFSGFVNAGDAATVPGEFAGITSAVQGSPAGSYPITLANAFANSNYSVTYTGANLTIDPVPLTITPNVSRLYGASLPSVLPTADFSGFVNGDGPSSLTSQPALNSAATVSTGVGTYGITASGAIDSNYTISYAPGTLTISPAPLLITPTNVSLTYGAVNPSFTAVSYSGLVNGDTSSVVSGLTIGTNAVIGGSPGVAPHLLAPVGTYELYGSGASAANYTISYAPGTLTITAASLIIQPSGTGTYGASPATNASVAYNAYGLVNGDTLASLTTKPTYTTSATNTSGVGLYSLLASGAADPNYAIRYEPGVLTINPATLTLTPAYLDVRYGTTGTPSDNYTVTGLANGDTLNTVFGSTAGISVNVPSISGASAGSTFQMFVQAPAPIDDNYVVSTPYVPLTISPAPLSIAANSVTTSSSTPPNLTGTFSGLVNGDTQASTGYGFTANLAAGTVSGSTTSYPITLTGSDPNYDVVYTAGTLTMPTNTNPITNQFEQTTFVDTNITPTNNSTITTNLTVQTAPDLTLTDPESNITLNPAALGAFGLIPEGEMMDIINEYVTALSQAGVPMTADQVIGQLENPATQPAMIGLLMPMVYADLTNILDEPQSSWTSDQSAFVQAVLSFINQQRQEAATQAEDDYAAWYQQQEAEEQAQVDGASGTAQLYIMAAQSANPPIPPASILQEAQLGMYMTNDQAVSYAGIEASGSDLAYMIENPGSTTTNASNTATNGVDLSLDALTMAQVIDSASGAKVFGPLFKNALPQLSRKIWPTMSAMTTLKNMRAKAKGGAGGTTAIDIEGDSSDVMDSVKAVLGTAAKALEIGGVALEVVGNVLQIGMAVADYGQIATYNTAFNQAIATDNAPLTVSGLQSMITGDGAGQVYNYLALMGATSPQALTPTLLSPSVSSSVYESL